MTDSTLNDGNLEDDARSIVASNATTSSKICSLAELGLARTEIRDLLGIRYQHVRKVLVDAGMPTVGASTRGKSGGGQRAISQPKPKVPWRDLLNLGFEVSGRWTLVEDGIILDGIAPGEPGVYAFVLNEEIVYVGLTQTALKTRMGHYRRGHVRQKTSARVKQLIMQALSDGGDIAVLTCVPGALDWNGLTLQLAPSLEASLISLIHPPWNIQGKRGGV